MGKKLDAALAENSELRTEITRLTAELEQLREQLELANLEAGVFTLEAPIEAWEELAERFKTHADWCLFDVSIWPFKGMAEALRTELRQMPGKAPTMIARFRMLPPGPDQP